MSDGVVMRVCQSSEIRSLIGKLRLVIIVPNLSPLPTIKLIYPLRCFDMKSAKHLAEAVGGFLGGGRVPNKMIVVGEHHPSFELPAKFGSNCQQSPMQDLNTGFPAKVVLFFIGGRRYKISSRFAKSMLRRMRPGCFSN